MLPTKLLTMKVQILWGSAKQNRFPEAQENMTLHKYVHQWILEGSYMESQQEDPKYRVEISHFLTLIRLS